MILISTFDDTIKGLIRLNLYKILKELEQKFVDNYGKTTSTIRCFH